jgi:hypothetical protein
MDRRVERLDQVVRDLLMVTENAAKIEKIEQRVSGIEIRVGELADSLQAEDLKSDRTPKPTQR